VDKTIEQPADSMTKQELIRFLLINKGLLLQNYETYIKYSKQELIDLFHETNLKNSNYEGHKPKGEQL
jgi:hypothetical protein